ncbi:MAG: hypothetical protein ACNA8H_15515, partial [Anaerolineales bacterium]
MNMKKQYTLFTFLIVISFLVAACQPTPVDEPTPVVPTEPIDEPTEPPVEPTEPPPPPEEVIFFSTQFVPVEEQEKFRAILQDGGFDFVASEEGPLIDLVRAGVQVGRSELDVVGALHGTFPPITDAMMNLIDVIDDLSVDREFPVAFIETGLLGTPDYLYYVPWM